MLQRPRSELYASTARATCDARCPSSSAAKNHARSMPRKLTPAKYSWWAKMFAGFMGIHLEVKSCRTSAQVVYLSSLHPNLAFCTRRATINDHRVFFKPLPRSPLTLHYDGGPVIPEVYRERLNGMPSFSLLFQRLIRLTAVLFNLKSRRMTQYITSTMSEGILLVVSIKFLLFLPGGKREVSNSEPRKV